MLLAPLLCMVDGQLIVVPDGFITDFASVPRLAQSIINSADPDIQKPSVLHDYLYSVRGHVPGRDVPYTRAQCDDLLAQGMTAAETNWLRRSIVWLAVRAGGWVPWRRQERTADTKTYALCYSARRSSKWPKIRAHHLKHEDWCRVCGTTANLEVHHIKPFWLFPELELHPGNLITLCESPHHMCHFRCGHFSSWRKYNPKIAEQATAKKITIKL